MALKTWHKAALVGAAMAALAVFILPPRPMRDWSSEQQGGVLSLVWEPLWRARVPGHENAVSDALGNYLRRAEILALMDSVRSVPASRVLHSDVAPLTIVHAATISRDSARAWMSMLEREVALIPGVPREASVPIVVLLLDKRLAENEPRPWLVLQFVADWVNHPVCVVATDVRWGRGRPPIRRTKREQSLRTDLLGRCLLLARFGSPGPAVGAWYGLEPQVWRWNMGRTLADFVEDAAHPAPESADPRQLAPDVRSCVHFAGQACLRDLGLDEASPRVRWNEYDWFYYGYWYRINANQLVAQLVVDDPVAFGRFWRSPAPPAQALSEAFGRPAADIVAGVERRYIRLDAAGPGVDGRVVLSSLGWIAVALIVGATMAGRRQVGE